MRVASSSRRCCSPTTKRTSSASSARRIARAYVKDAFHEFRRPRTIRRGEPGACGHEGGASLRARCAGGMARRSSACGSRRRPDPQRPAETGSVTGSTRQLQQSRDEAERVLRRHDSRRTSPATRAMSCGRPRPAALDEAVLSLRREGLARGRSRTTRRRAAERARGRNHDWTHLYNRDVISMPDKWEYPWYAAWDLAFHMIPFAQLDPEFAKDQLVLFLREWYMHPNGQLPAYEWAAVGRQSAGARVGRLARLQDDRRGRPAATASSSRASSRSCC